MMSKEEVFEVLHTVIALVTEKGHKLRDEEVTMLARLSDIAKFYLDHHEEDELPFK